MLQPGRGGAAADPHGTGVTGKTQSLRLAPLACEGDCGLALPVAEEASPEFPQPRRWRAVAKQARERQLRQGGGG